MEEARQAGAGVLPELTDFASTAFAPTRARTRDAMLDEVLESMISASDQQQRAQRGLRLLCKGRGAKGGHLYLLTEEGIVLAASEGERKPPAGLREFLERYLHFEREDCESATAIATEQQLNSAMPITSWSDAHGEEHHPLVLSAELDGVVRQIGVASFVSDGAPGRRQNETKLGAAIAAHLVGAGDVPTVIAFQAMSATQAAPGRSKREPMWRFASTSTGAEVRVSATPSGFQRLVVIEALALAALAGCADRGEPAEDGRRPVNAPSAPAAPHAGMGGGGGTGEMLGGMNPQPTTPPATHPSAGNDSECPSTSKTAEVQHAPVDIVWAIDTSASMVDEIAAVEANITQFADMISMAGIDHHVIMLALIDIAAATPLAMDPAHYQYVLAPVGSNDALQVMLDSYPAYSAFLRPEASLHFVVVTDDESWVAAADFQTQMEALAGKKFFFHSIASPDAPGPCVGECGLPIVCGAFAPGIQYYALSDATAGQKISVCTADWTQVFAPLQQAVISSAPLPCDYPNSGSARGPDARPRPRQPGVRAGTGRYVRAVQASRYRGRVRDEPGVVLRCPRRPDLAAACSAACERVRTAGGTINIAFGCKTKTLTVD